MVLRPEQARALADLLLSGETDNGSDLRGPDSGVLVDDAAPGPQHIGRYRVTRLIGHGGMGVVYEAQQEHPARRVALKIVRAELVSPELARRLDHEARVLGRLEHPGIARIYEAGSWQPPVGGPSSPYFAMEYVEGKPLTDYVKQHKLSLTDRLELFLAVCDAVEHAHRRGVIHRDLKPGNILVDAEGKPRVLDFGLARATDADVRLTTVHTEVGKLLGTLPYMSPEQVSGDPDATDTRSDVYALGVVLYELLADKPPYQVGRGVRGGIAEAARIIRDTDPTPLSSIDRAFRGDLDVIGTKALAKEKDSRYQSVSDLAADVRRYLRHEPILAQPAGTWYHIWKFAARHRAICALTAALCVCGVLLLGAVASVAVRQRALARETARHLAAETAHAQRAEAHEADALRQASIKQGVLNFMEEMFARADPRASGRRDLTVVEWLHVASDGIERGALADPELEAAIHNFLGASYSDVGEPERALRHLRRAWDLDTTRLGVLHPGTASATASLASVLGDLGRHEEAEPHFRHVLDMPPGDTVESFEPFASAVVGLSDLLSHTSRAPAAISLLDGALPDLLARLGPEHRMYILARQGRATALGWAGRPREALEETVALRQDLEATRGAHDAHVIDALRLEGMALISAGRYEEAESVLRRVLHTMNSTLGERHPDRIRALLGLANALMQQRRAQEAEPMLREVCELSADVMGSDSDILLTALEQLSVTLRQQERFEECEAIVRDLLDRRSAVQGPDHHSTIGTEVALGQVLRRRGKHAESNAQFAAAFEHAQRVLDRRHPDALFATYHYADVLLRGAECERALPLIEEYLSDVVEVFGPQKQNAIMASVLHGRCLHCLGRLGEALADHTTAVEKARKAPTGARIYLGHALLQIGRVSADLLRFSEARAALEECLDIYTAVRPGREAFDECLQALAGVCDRLADADAANRYRAMLTR